MSKILTDNKYYGQIADVIREQNGTSNTYKPQQIVTALKDLFYEEVEGVPPISFNGIGENLLDYRIDGASGGVGDRTGNLFDGSWENKFIATYGNIGYSTNRVLSSYVTVIPNQTYSVKSNMRIRAVHSYNDATHTQALIDSVAGLDGATFTIPADSNSIRISLKKANDGEFTPDDIDWFMLNAGSTALPYEPYGYKVPVVVNGKNLFDETQVPDKSTSTETSNYQIFKQNGKLIVNGITTSSQVDTEISKENGVNNQALDFINNNAGNYIFTSSVPGRIMIRYKQNGSDVVRYTFNEYNSTNKIADRIVFRLQQNYQYDNETMNIMFKLNKIQSTNYEPYHEPTTTTIYLDEPIEENESISLSDTNINIPTIRGTNILTVDTTIQPSNVYIKSRHESSYEAAMRERYEEAQAQLDALESGGE